MSARLFVLQVETGNEARFLDLAKRNPALTGRTDIRFWWPRRRLFIRRRGRHLRTLAPLFPGYVFVETDEISPEVYSTIRNTAGFHRFLRSNHDIQPLAGSDLEVIRHFFSFGEVVSESRVTFDAQNRIEVVDGPLKGLEGLIVKVDKRKGRAKVKLDMYENSFLIDLGFEIMEHAKKPKAS